MKQRLSDRILHIIARDGIVILLIMLAAATSFIVHLGLNNGSSADDPITINRKTNNGVQYKVNVTWDDHFIRKEKNFQMLCPDGTKVVFLKEPSEEDFIQACKYVIDQMGSEIEEVRSRRLQSGWMTRIDFYRFGLFLLVFCYPLYLTMRILGGGGEA